MSQQTATKPIPAHLLPTSCYVCGAAELHHDRTAEGGHGFWSNADARAYFEAEDARRVAPALRLEGPAFPDAGYSS